jgi:hypothetical protein
MAQKVRFHPSDGSKARRCTPPHDGASYVVVEGPSCPCSPESPFHAAGVRGSMVKGHDTCTSDAGCIGCKVVTGKLVVTVSTIFGIEEDERVLSERCRVY